MGSIVSVSTSSIVNRELLWGLIVSVSTSSVVDRGIKPLWGQTKDNKTAASPPNTSYEGVRAKSGWLGIRIMCPSGATCLPVDYCFSELAL